MKSHIILLAIPLLVAVSCDKNQAGGDTPTTEMYATPASLEFDNNAGTKTFTITSDMAPSRIASNADWCTVKAGTYSGNSISVEVTVTENTGTSTRQATISANGNKKSITVPVTQNIKKVALAVSETSFSSECYGNWDASFTITSATQPSVSSDSQWCTVAVGKQDSDRKTEVKVYIGANRTEKSRQGTLTVSCGDESKTISLSQKAYAVQTATTEALTPQMVFDALQMGWGMGNHMDAFDNDVASETCWGNDKCTQQTMDKAKQAGFASVRIPVTWMGHIGEAGAYKIEDKWMDRVAEIVGYAHNAGLKVIINTHHDENDNGSAAHWLDIKSAYANSAKNETIKDEIACVWSQIALKFKDCGEWLIFEPFNEIQDGGWGWSDAFRADPAPQYKVLNEWNQVFVDAVRATGGENATRWLATVGYCQSSGTISINGLEIPKDHTSANRIMVGFHDYDPYLYTLNKPLVEQWGHTAAADKRCSDQDEKNVTDTFDLFVKTYSAKGIPMYIGEMGCSFHSGDNFKFQKYYIEYFCKAAADRGIPMIVWDNGAKGTGAECHSYLDHGTGEYQNQNAKDLVDLMVKAVTDKDPEYTLQSVWDSAPEQ